MLESVKLKYQYLCFPSLFTALEKSSFAIIDLLRERNLLL